MSGLQATYTVADQTIASTTKVIFAIDAPTNQKCRVGVNVFCREPTGATMVKVEFKRRGTNDGAKSSVTWVKINPQDAESIQTAGYTYSGAPSNNGTVVRHGDVTSQRNVPFPPFQCEGGGKYDVVVTTAASVSIGAEITLEE
jgi:hypothetical protein